MHENQTTVKVKVAAGKLSLRSVNEASSNSIHVLVPKDLNISVEGAASQPRYEREFVTAHMEEGSKMLFEAFPHIELRFTKSTNGCEFRRRVAA